MTDRKALLEAIRANPAEDLPRLLYADWLEEFGEGDRDAATAQFVRVSCDQKPGGRHTGRTLAMPRQAYAWVAANWRRLVPAAVALCVPDPQGWAYPSFHSKGRWVHAKWRVKRESILFPGAVREFDYSVRLSFLRGFCSRVLMWSPVARDALTGAFVADQPLATFGTRP